jgi:hypothetical protein
MGKSSLRSYLVISFGITDIKILVSATRELIKSVETEACLVLQVQNIVLKEILYQFLYFYSVTTVRNMDTLYIHFLKHALAH